MKRSSNISRLSSLVVMLMLMLVGYSSICSVGVFSFGKYPAGKTETSKQPAGKQASAKKKVTLPGSHANKGENREEQLSCSTAIVTPTVEVHSFHQGVYIFAHTFYTLVNDGIRCTAPPEFVSSYLGNIFSALIIINAP